jgi:hypothetical protein
MMTKYNYGGNTKQHSVTMAVLEPAEKYLLNPLKRSGNYMYHLPSHSQTILHSVHKNLFYIPRDSHRTGYIQHREYN